MALKSVLISEGSVDFHISSINKKCKTWYRIYGDIHAPNTRPCVLLHGGPGMGHDYLLSLADLTIRHGIPVVFYDQVGCGKSTLLSDRRGDTSFWTPELFLDELDNLLKHLDIQDSYNVFGNSWGGMLGAQHALRQPKGLHRLVIADSPSDMHIWVAAANKLRSQLPKTVQEILLKHESAGSTDSEEYELAVFEFYKRHLCRLDPMPMEVLRSLDNVKKDDTVYWTMNGPSEFFVIGNLKDWVLTSEEIQTMSVSTLVINGAYDEATDDVVAPWFRNLPHVKWVQFANSSHTPHWEERERFMKVVSDFLET